MVPHQWPMALVVIWQIYSCLACSSEDSARDLPSSGKVVLGQGQVPCEFQADWPTFIFQLVAPDVNWHIYSHLYCSSRNGSRDLPSLGEAAPTMGQVSCEFWAGGSWRDLAHLLALVVLLLGWWQELAIFRGGSPYRQAGPLWVLSRLAKLHF